jgi:hypothetical protein
MLRRHPSGFIRRLASAGIRKPRDGRDEAVTSAGHRLDAATGPSARVEDLAQRAWFPQQSGKTSSARDPIYWWKNNNSRTSSHEEKLRRF